MKKEEVTKMIRMEKEEAEKVEKIRIREKRKIKLQRADLPQTDLEQIQDLIHTTGQDPAEKGLETGTGLNPVTEPILQITINLQIVIKGKQKIGKDKENSHQKKD